MTVSLKRALMEILTGWPDDLPPEWRDACSEVELGLGNVDPQLELEFWEPVFPVRRGRNFPGMPVGAHMLRACEGIPPHHVRCVILGQNSYPAPDFATGDPDWQKFVGEIWEIEAILAEDVMIMNPARFAQVVATARV
jgi:uracil-DNA glycosylase